MPENKCETAARTGDLTALVTAWGNGHSWGRTAFYAAENNDQRMLRWARKHGCHWNGGVCAMAAKNGNLKLLKWARNHGCDWNRRVCQYATHHKHKHVLNWVHENGCPCDHNKKISGVLDVLGEK